MTALAPLPFGPLPPDPLTLSQQMLHLLGTQVTVSGLERLPPRGAMVVVSNHRSLIDVPVLMTALNRTIAFACHHYMANVPVLRDVVAQFQAFPLDVPHRRHRTFFQRASGRLQRRQTLGIFPEGAQPMVKVQPPGEIHGFHRGFAHLALRAPVDRVAVLPVALVSPDRGFESPMPLRVLSWFDPTEPLFQQEGGHPFLVYRQVQVRVGQPLWITAAERQHYRGGQGGRLAQDLTDRCHGQVQQLLQGATVDG